MSMYDFELTLRKWLKQTQPKRILEYGPGLSTSVMLQECPNSNITSIEHQIKWYKKSKKRFKNKARIVYVPANNIKSHYACWPLMQNSTLKYDLIFIDGRRRVECLVAGLEVLNTDGVIILHDAFRKEYQHGISLYDVIEDHGHTKVLKKKTLPNSDLVTSKLVESKLNESTMEINEIQGMSTKSNKPECNTTTTYITAAYGSKYHRYVKGLAKTFANSNTSNLIIYSDSTDLNIPGAIVDNSLSIQQLKEYAREYPLNSTKPLILLDAARKHKNLCWIDADMLIFTDLSARLDEHSINIISYGFGTNLRDCGAGLKLKQEQYCLSGLFACSSDYVFQYEEIWHELKMEIAKKAKLYDQSLLNHLIERNKNKVKYLNLEYPNMIWNFEKYQPLNKRGSCHPLPTNRVFCRGINVQNNRLYHDSTPIAVHCWTSVSLENHIKSNFRYIPNLEARNYLLDLYG